MSSHQEPSGAITQSEARNQRLSHLLEAERCEGLEPSGAITQSEARNQRLSHLLEAERGEGLEAAVLNHAIRGYHTFSRRRDARALSQGAITQSEAITPSRGGEMRGP